MKWIVVGLGNPGLQYVRDRHNAGFHVIDALSNTLGLTASQPRFRGELYEGRIGSTAVILVKPLTYMNLSGESVAPLADLHQVPPEQILVIHDELELPLGRLKLKKGGGEAGHRGLLSLSLELETRAYPRLRFGIGRPTDPSISIPDYVLHPPSPEEEELWEASVQQAVSMTISCMEDGVAAAMNEWNGRLLSVPTDETYNLDTPSGNSPSGEK